MVITRFGALSCAKIVGTLYAIVGLLLGGILSVIATAGGLASSARGVIPLGALGFGAIIFFPILYGCIGFVGALAAAWLYNLVAGLVGGIEIEVQQ